MEWTIGDRVRVIPRGKTGKAGFSGCFGEVVEIIGESTVRLKLDKHPETLLAFGSKEIEDEDLS